MRDINRIRTRRLCSSFPEGSNNHSLQIHSAGIFRSNQILMRCKFCVYEFYISRSCVAMMLAGLATWEQIVEINGVWYPSILKNIVEHESVGPNVLSMRQYRESRGLSNS